MDFSVYKKLLNLDSSLDKLFFIYFHNITVLELNENTIFF